MSFRFVTHAMAAGAVSAFASGVSAEDTTQPPQALPEVVVTATATPRALQTAPASVTVVDRQALSRRPVQDLTDVLRDVPGVTVNGAGLTRRGISIRGMPSEHTLFLVDGRRVNGSASAIAHADFELNWVPVEAMDRVEIVRGPMSSLYGSEALGGVVNVITRSATDSWRGSLRAMGGLREDGRGGETYQLGAYAGGPLLQDRYFRTVWASAFMRNRRREATRPKPQTRVYQTSRPARRCRVRPRSVGRRTQPSGSTSPFWPVATIDRATPRPQPRNRSITATPMRLIVGSTPCRIRGVGAGVTVCCAPIAPPWIGPTPPPTARRRPARSGCRKTSSMGASRRIPSRATA